jgi:predicted AAA+ superfamily ATPase
MTFPDHGYANLEAPDQRDFALNDPRGFLAQFPRGGVIDEVQRAPELVSYLQPLIDEDPTPGRWILTGSQNLMLLESVSQSLAGRTALLHLLPLTWAEIARFEDHPSSLDHVLFTGGLPAYLRPRPRAV